jgi:predicted dehydrogenase
MSQTSANEPIGTDIGVAVIGMGWMGHVHARSYARLPHHFPDLPVPRLVAVADVEPANRESALRYGPEQVCVDWQEVLANPAIDAVSVTVPNFLHAEIGAAVAAAGKHLWIEKPVGMHLADAQSVAKAVAAAGVQSTVGFNYRNAPAVRRARDLIAEGAIGEVTHAHIRMFSDYAAHPHGALSWRFEQARGGSGVLGDLMSHGADLMYFLVGEMRTVLADTALFVPQRPVPTGATSHFARAEGGELGPVENDDYAVALVRGDGGQRVLLEASRVSVGDQNTYAFDVHGTSGGLRWDFRRMGELEVSTGGEYQDQPYADVYVGPGSGDYAQFQPGSGIAMGYDDLKVIEAAGFLRSIRDGRPHGATIADAVRTASVLEAMTESAASGRWTALAALDPAGADLPRVDPIGPV